MGPLTLMLLILAISIPSTYLSGLIDRRLPKYISLIFSLIVLGISLWIFPYFDGSSGEFQLVERYPWIPSIGSSLQFGIDGISYPLVLMTALLAVAAIVISWHDIGERENLFYSLLLFTELGLIGTFISLDLFLFVVFWEIVLLPMFFIIGIWGGPRREYAAYKFFIYTHLGGLLMVIGIIALYLKTGKNTFSIPDLLVLAKELPFDLKILISTLMFLGFVIKLPAFPFHTWLPDAHVEAPTAGSVLLAGSLLKMGGYGLVRFNAQMFPDTIPILAPIILGMALANIIYTALVAMSQRDLKSLIAYSSIVHMGIVLLGVAAMTPLAIAGAVFQMVSHGFIAALLFMIAGTVHHKFHTREIPEIRGMGLSAPTLAAILVAASFASLGLPGFSGFVAEITVFLGAYKVYKLITAIAVVCVIFTVGYYLRMLKRVIFGEPNREAEEMHPSEVLIMLLVLLPIVLLGIYPQVLFGILEGSALRIALAALGG